MLAVTAAGSLPGQQISDIVPPPSAASVSPTGVSYQYGSYEFSRDWLTVGSGGFPAEMTFRTVYSSAADQYLGDWGKTRHNWGAKMSRVAIDKTGGPLPSDWVCETSISVGNRSDSFQKYGCGNSGTYDYGLYHGTTLVYDAVANIYTYTMRNGGTVTFPSSSLTLFATADKWTEPDGTTFTFGFGTGGLTSVFSNRGFGFILQYSTGSTKICAVSLARDYLVNGSACPTGAPFITIADSSGVITSITDATGGVWTFQGTGYMTCYKEPASAVCQVNNSWQGTGNTRTDRVASQSFPDSSSLTYGYQTARNPLPTDPDPWTYFNFQTTVTDSASGVSTFYAGAGTSAMLPQWTRDPLLRQTSYTFNADNALSGITYPETNQVSSLYDDRYNPTERRQKAKTGTGLADIVTSATYTPSSGFIGMFPTCTYPKSCNKPLTITDPRSNTTNYTYDNSHGGVLTETKPAVGGIRPQTRYEYAQRYAWLKNSGGTFSQAATPVWLLVKERYCRTTAASGQTCAGGAADEVVTDYDYGPNSGPNTLLLRGKTVTADSTTLRTCYGYDAFGHRISETKPNANLASCP